VLYVLENARKIGEIPSVSPGAGPFKLWVAGSIPARLRFFR